MTWAVGSFWLIWVIVTILFLVSVAQQRETVSHTALRTRLECIKRYITWRVHRWVPDCCGALPTRHLHVRRWSCDVVGATDKRW